MARIPAYRITEAQWLTIIGAGTQVPNALYFVEISTSVVRLYETDNAGTPNPRIVGGNAHKGAYAGGTTYLFGDLVRQNGSTWFCVAASTVGNAPPTLPTTSNTQWELLTQKGDPGTNYYNPGPLAEAVASGDITEGGWYIDYSAASAVNITKVRAVAFNSSGGEGSFVLRLKDQDNNTIYGPVTVEFGTALDADVDLDWSGGDAILAEINSVDDVQSYLVQAQGTQA